MTAYNQHCISHNDSDGGGGRIIITVIVIVIMTTIYFSYLYKIISLILCCLSFASLQALGSGLEALRLPQLQLLLVKCRG